MRVLRTPDARFDALPDFPYAPNYLEIDSGGGQPLRIAYVDEGPRDGPTVLLMHGEPTWDICTATSSPPCTGGFVSLRRT